MDSGELRIVYEEARSRAFDERYTSNTATSSLDCHEAGLRAVEAAVRASIDQKVKAQVELLGTFNKLVDAREEIAALRQRVDAIDALMLKWRALGDGEADRAEVEADEGVAAGIKYAAEFFYRKLLATRPRPEPDGEEGS